MDVKHYLEHVGRDYKLWRLNLKLSKNIRRDLEQSDDNFIYRAARADELKKIEELHLMLVKQPMIGWIRWVYKFRAKELISVVIDKKDNSIVGYDLFMFNEAEVSDNYIHELFVGIIPKYQGLGLSTKLRKYSLECYDHGRLSGVSTLAFFTDIKALRSAQKSGFAIIKQSAKPPAHYLLHKLSLYK